MIACYHLTVPHPGRQTPLLDDVTFEIDSGAFAEVVGPSGSGKTPLFSVLSLRKEATTGRCVIGGRHLAKLDDDGWARLRRRLGSCAESPELLDEQSVFANLAVPLIARDEADSARERIADLIADTAVEQLEEVPVRRLAGAERRLVGIFRALVGQPELVLIDDGLSGLGALRSEARTALLRAHERGATILVFGRRRWFSGQFARAWRLEQGELRCVEGDAEPTSVVDGAA